LFNPTEADRLTQLSHPQLTAGVPRLLPIASASTQLRGEQLPHEPHAGQEQVMWFEVKAHVPLLGTKVVGTASVVKAHVPLLRTKVIDTASMVKAQVSVAYHW
jgi:hypothetical protein